MKWLKRIYDSPLHSVLGLALRWYLAWVFISACLHKIQHPELFAIDVATYQILPLSLINIMAITLPWIELGAALMLIIGFRARAASLMVAGMMIVFMIALKMALDKGLDMSCGCFASGGAGTEDPISMDTMWRDAKWLLMSLYIVFFDRLPLGVDAFLVWRRRGAERTTS